MANSPQAIKRARQAEKRRVQNAAYRSVGRTAVKKVLAQIREGNQEKARDAYKAAVSILDHIAGKRIIHKNKASRYKKRLNMHIRNLAPESDNKKDSATSS